MKEYNLNDTHLLQLDSQKDPIALHTEDLHVFYGDNEAIKGVDLQLDLLVAVNPRIYVR